MKKILLTPILLCLCMAVFGQDSVSITFHVNMSMFTVDSTGVFIAGGTGFGAPGDNEMLDPDGDGVYSITLSRPDSFSSHYTFLNGNCSDWSCKENITGQACADPNNFNDRFIAVGVNDTSVSTCFQLCTDNTTCSAPDSVDVTFNVNMSMFTVDSTGVYIAGGAGFGGPGDNQLLDPDGDGVYSITLSRPAGFASHYTFLNGNCSDWSCKENISGQSCADPNNFNDRFIALGVNDTTVNTCFEECTDDTNCSVPNPPVNVTFRVSMAGVTVDPAGVIVTGNFEGWSGSIQMDDSNNDMIYEYTASIAQNTVVEWKFLNGAWANEESFDPATADSACTMTTDIFTNRVFTTGDTDTVLTAFCFDTCDDCGESTGINDLLLDANLFSIQPNRVSGVTNLVFSSIASGSRMIEVLDASGRKVITNELRGNELRSQLNVSTLSPGMYFVMVRQSDKMGIKKMIVIK